MSLFLIEREALWLGSIGNRAPLMAQLLLNKTEVNQ